MIKKDFDDEKTINQIIEIHISTRSLSKDKQFKCWFYPEKQGSSKDYCELKVNRKLINDSVEWAKEFKLAKFLTTMKQGKPLTLAVVLKNVPEEIVGYFP